VVIDGHGSPVKIAGDFRSFQRNFERHFKNLYLTGKWVQRAQIGLV
jgi:hypothetical protein